MRYKLILSTLLTLLSINIHATEFNVAVPMTEKHTSTFYVPTKINGLDNIDFMVDTGSSYSTINEETLASLQRNGNAAYIQDLQGILANNQKIIVPVYRISNMNIGGQCNIKDIDVAVFPGKTRQILGLNTLKNASPFIFSMDPPQLILSHCENKISDNQIAKLPMDTESMH